VKPIQAGRQGRRSPMMLEVRRFGRGAPGLAVWSSQDRERCPLGVVEQGLQGRGDRHIHFAVPLFLSERQPLAVIA